MVKDSLIKTLCTSHEDFGCFRLVFGLSRLQLLSPVPQPPPAETALKVAVPAHQYNTYAAAVEAG